MSPIILAVAILGGIGIISASLLYVVASKFKVTEDPRIEEIENILPGANCGGCGFNGCHDFSVTCVKRNSIEGLLCPVGGEKAMTAIADCLGLKAEAVTPKVAVLKCNGSCMVRKHTTLYDGPRSCAIERIIYAGETDCPFGCLGCGDCVAACMFGAVAINPETMLPEFDEEKCTACGACVNACPSHIIELRNKGPKGRRVYVACSNHDRGAVAMRECKVSCIGCGKCAKACAFGAITVADNLAYIDYEKCRLCRKCVDVCPEHCIKAVNFPIPKVKQETTETAVC